MFDAGKIASYGVVYASMGFNIFIFCYLGEIITEQVIRRELKYIETRKC